MDDSRPTVASRKQFRFLASRHHLHEAYKSILRSAPPVYNKPELAEEFVTIILDSVRDPNVDDEEIYRRLRLQVYPHEGDNWTEILRLARQRRDEFKPIFDSDTLIRRGMNRARAVQKALPPNFAVDTLLDIGCAEGSITSSLTRVFRIQTSEAWGTDIHAPPSSVEHYRSSGSKLPFQFVAVNPNDPTLEFKDGFFSLVTAMMSLHHIQHIESIVREIYRILCPGGCLVIREHDCESTDFEVLLDLAHGQFSLVWGDPMEDPDFLSTYEATYRSRSDWRQMLRKVGFTLVEDPYPLNQSGSFRAYIDVFQKPMTVIARPRSAGPPPPKKKKKPTVEETSAPSEKGQEEEEVKTAPTASVT